MVKKAEEQGFFNAVYDVVRKIPMGKVTTYGAIAAMTGFPKRARYVGYALHVNPEPYVIPCHRVVNRFGELSGAFAFGGIDVQERLLLSEGVEVRNRTVDLDRYFWSE